ncbi:MAG TPA: hypothetical protein VJ440_08390, partial [Candidatus Brocadiaceae bacterium]|nr:hypothetical protein [Candidatus Brocadiaceae bacterium]
MKKYGYHWLIAILFLSGVFVMNTTAFAHHGGVSSAFGPGAPIETASPLALGKGRYLIYEKFESAPFEHKDHAEPENIGTFTFFNTVLGYGVTDALSFYGILPFARKKQDSLGTSDGFGDLGLVVQYGFNPTFAIRGVYE